MIPAGPYARRMARPLRSLLRRVSTTPIDVTVLKGQRMRLHAQGNSCEKRILIIPHLFDRYELHMLSHVLRPGSTFIDVGANVGIYSIFAALHAGPHARIIAVEPHPLALERLRCNILINNLANITVEPVALGDRQGPIMLKSYPSNIGRSSILFDHNGPAHNLIEVQGETLEGLCAKHGLKRIDALKLDAEGAEDRILFPFFASASSGLWPRLVLIEDSSRKWRQDCLGLLRQMGYRQKKIPYRNRIFWRPTSSPGAAN